MGCGYVPVELYLQKQAAEAQQPLPSSESLQVGAGGSVSSCPPFIPEL